MTVYEVVDVRSGKVLDRVAISAGQSVPMPGSGYAGMVGRLLGRGMLPGWSNGYLAVREEADTAPVALLDRAKACRAALLNNTRLLASINVDGPQVWPVMDLRNVSRMPAQLRRYWLTHEAWGKPGAFDACVKDLREHGVPGRMVEGACANLHKEATGEWPGQRRRKGKAGNGHPPAIVAEFTELKVRRDRKGRFAKKNSGEILAELDDIVARLGALKGSIRNEDHQSEVDDALDRLTTVRDEHKVQAVRTEAALDTGWEGEVRFNAGPGAVEVDHDRETWDLTPGEAEQLAKALDDLAAVEVPKRPDRNAPVEALDRVEIDADSGSFFAERLDDGSFEVGSIDDDGNDVEGLRLNGPVEAEEFADLLEEMAEKASRREDDPIWDVPGRAKNASRTVPSGTYERLEVTANRDGTVTFGFDDGNFTRPAADVRKVSRALSDLRTVPVPTGDDYTTGEAGRVTISDDLAVVKWNTGQYEIGDPAEFDPDESGPSVLLLDGDGEAAGLVAAIGELVGSDAP